MAGGEVIAAFADYFIESIVKLIDKVISVDISAGFHDLIIRNAFLTQKNVAADGAGEEKDILKHLPKMLSQGGELDLSNVNTVDKYFALLKLIITADKGEDCCFAGACRSDKSNRVIWVDVEGYSLEHPFAGDIAEPNILEFYLALDAVKFYRIRCVHYFGNVIHDCKHLFC